MTHASFAARLAALGSETPDFVDGARVLDHADALTALLDEIDATVLPAALTFQSDTGALTLLATGRRLHKITDGAPDGVLDQAMDPDNGDLTQDAAHALAAFCDGASAMRVSHGCVAAQNATMSGRVSVRALNTALGRVNDDPDAPPYERFVARMADSFGATIHIQNRVAKDMTGPSVDLAQLKIILSTQFSGFIDTRNDKCASHSDPSLTLLGDVLEPGTTLGIAVFETDMILFSMPTADTAKASQTFYRVL